MIDISHKSSTLRTAIAGAELKVSPSSIEAIENNTVPKGDVRASARIAAFFAVKNTPQALPHCHPMPVEHTEVRFQLTENSIKIEVEVKTIYKTGCEIEALYGASVAAMTLYDMLKPIDEHLEITSIKLLSKKGGKSDFTEKYKMEYTAAVVVISDSVSAGLKEDRSGKAIMEKLEKHKIEVVNYQVMPDELEQIQQTVRDLRKAQPNFIILTGGTGLSPRDVTPEAIKPLLDTEIPGITETIRGYGQLRTPYSMLSRSVAGLIGNTLVLALPGSVSGATESMDAIFPHILHIFRVVEGRRHD